MDIDAVEKTATEDTKKLPKDKVIPTFTETYTKGKGVLFKSSPWFGRQSERTAAALQEFIRCEALYLRIDAEKMMTPEVEDNEKQASMLRYACMKMTILSH